VASGQIGSSGNRPAHLAVIGRVYLYMDRDGIWNGNRKEPLEKEDLLGHRPRIAILGVLYHGQIAAPLPVPLHSDLPVHPPSHHPLFSEIIENGCKGDRMMLRSIWERYLFRELLKVFFLFLGCFFFLYSILDYSLHMQDFLVDKHIHFSHLLIYYSYQFIKRADLLIPLALLIATLKVLFSLNARRELVALLASGISSRRILRPFFLLATLCTLFQCASMEFLLPSSLNFLDLFRQSHFKHNFHGNRKEPIHVIYLKDLSKIVYQSEDQEKQLYFDVFWIRSADDIWRMKYLSTNPEEPVGYFVDHIVGSPDGSFEKCASFEKYAFPSFRVQPDLTGKGYVPIENRRPSELLRMITHKRATTAFEYPQALTHFLHKCVLPFLPFLVVIAAAPFCFCYSRSLPIFFTYAIALFGFVAFAAYINSAIVLGETQVLSAYNAILLPFALCFLGFGWKFIKSIGYK
jgi:lipopolysaccharide export system permease protein